MNNTCNVCNKGFTPTTTKGSEQKYCSSSCRTIASQQRQKEKIINDYENAKDQYTNSKNSITSNGDISGTLQHTTNRNNHNTLPEGQNRIDNTNNHYKPETSISNNNGFGYSSDYIGLLGKYYETTGEARFMHSELTKANDKIRELQNELEIYYDEDDEIEKLELAQKNAPQHEQIMKSFADMFREDPVNTTNMVTTLVPSIIGGIADMFKTKTA